MNRKVYQIVLSVTRVVVMVAFISTIFFANANLSLAASAKKKPSAVATTSAVSHTEARIKQLQGTLKVTAAQEELWNNLTQVMRENAKDMDALTKDLAESTKTMNAVEHMKLHSRITEAHLDQMKKFLPPFEAFYNSMSDEQKQNTDKIFRTGIDGRSKRK